jgi:hypothetical protein
VKGETAFQQVVHSKTVDQPPEQLERRRHSRFPLSVDAELIERQSGARLSGRATDLGAGGCYIDSLSTFPSGTQVDVLLHSEGRTFHCRGFVSHTDTSPSIGVGLAFTETAPDQKGSLLDWVRELGATVPSRAGALLPADTPSEPAAKSDQGDATVALRELVSLLVRKGLLTEAETAGFRDGHLG